MAARPTAAWIWMPSANTMTVNVTAVNDAPAGTNNTVTTLEDTQYTFAAADFGFTDPNDSPANALTAVTITTMPGAGSLTLSGVAVTAGQSISVANINSGNLKFAPAANANGAGYASFTFQVQDDGGTANGGVDLDQSANTMTVERDAVNDAPAGTDNTVTTLEDTQYTFAAADFGFTDPNDSPANALSCGEDHDDSGRRQLDVVGRCGDRRPKHQRCQHQLGQLEVRAGGQCQRHRLRELHVPGAGQRRHRQRRRRSGSIGQHDDGRRDGGERCTGGHRQHGHAHSKIRQYTFSAADFGFTDPNDSPANALSAVKITTIPGAGSLTLSGVAVTAGQSISVANINSGNLKFAPAADANGAGYASFTFQVQDDGGTANGGVDLDASANTLTVDVTSVNDAPAGTEQHGHHARRHAVHLRRGRLRLHRSERQPGQCAERGEDHDDAGCGQLDLVGRRGDRGSEHQRGEHQLRQLEVHCRQPMPTVRATRASRSRCRTTAAPPTAAWIWMHRPTR